MANVTKAILKALGDHLATKIPELQQVNLEFPSANVQLKYPCLTITAGEPKFEPYHPYHHSVGEPNAEFEVASKYVTGQWDWTLQLDLWCRSKEERHDLFQKLFAGINSQLPLMGLSLTLEDYHDLKARYELLGFQPSDDEASAQRREWRAIANVAATCHAILETVEHVIDVTEITLTASENVSIEE